MKLTKKQKEIVEKYFNDIVKNIKCHICGNKKLKYQDNIYYFKEFNKKLLYAKTPQVYPVIILYCEKCSHSMLFNAISMGVIKK